MVTSSRFVVWGTTASVGLALYGLYRGLTSSQTMHLPPSPATYPLVGHLFSMPNDYPEKRYAEWAKTHGDIIHLKVLGKSFIILGSPQAARDLLEKRIYSDRPRFILLIEMMGWGDVTTQMPYGDRFRKHRRWLQDYLKPEALQNYRTLQEYEAAAFIQDLLQAPDCFKKHVKRYASAVILKIAYGHSVTSVDDEYVRLADVAADRTAKNGTAGAVMVDVIPALRHIPTWFPGAGFKREAISISKDVIAMMTTPFEMVKSKMKSGTAYPSFTSGLLESHQNDGTLTKETEEEIKAVAGTLYIAGTDTTSVTIETFILAMVHHPEVYQRAQAEMDRVVGPSRLPDLNDRISLPYLEAILKETYRWNTPGPLGIPHKLMEDDEYRGYHIPKGAIVMANIWAMNQNPEHYPEPHLFRPERFMPNTHIDNTPPPDPKDVVFGFGRRICPGKQFADSSIWLVVASMIATVKISKALDENGKEITPRVAFASSFISHPEPFKCRIEPRSEATMGLVSQAKTHRQL